MDMGIVKFLGIKRWNQHKSVQPSRIWCFSTIRIFQYDKM